MQDNSKCLSTIEWEGLLYEYEIKDEIRSELLQNTNNSKIKLWRDENYLISGKLEGHFKKGEKELITKDLEAGELVSPSIIEGSNFNQTEKFRLEGCYLTNINYGYELQASGEYAKKYNAILKQHLIRRFFKSKENAEWITDWYINGPRGPYWFPRRTERKYTEKYERNREVYSTKENIFNGNISKEFSRDYLFIQLPKFSFIIHKVPKGYGPPWSENVGIEYSQQFGEFPTDKMRLAICELVSFIFGRHLLHIGYSLYDKNGNSIEEVSLNPWGNNVVSYCKQHEKSPLLSQNFEDKKNVEEIVSQLLPRYLELREEFALYDVLWRYWIAESLPLEIKIPILHNGIEILVNNWFKSTKSKTHGVYLPKMEFDDLLNEEFLHIEGKLNNINYGDRIIKKIRGSFQAGANDKIEFFLQEIGLEIGDLECKAIRERNKMIHGAYSPRSDMEKSVLLLDTYKTFFQRVLLKVLDYKGSYIDYAVIGWPLKDINQVAGS